VTAQPTAPDARLAQALERLAADAQSFAESCRLLLPLLRDASQRPVMDAPTKQECTAPIEARPQNALMTAAELAGVLRLNLRTLRAMRGRGELPPSIRVGSRLRWRRADVEAWIRERGAA
jgi:excisionase family DNA binding protein